MGKEIRCSELYLLSTLEKKGCFLPSDLESILSWRVTEASFISDILTAQFVLQKSARAKGYKVLFWVVLDLLLIPVILVIWGKPIKKILFYNSLKLNIISFNSSVLCHTIHTFPLKSTAVTTFFGALWAVSQRTTKHSLYFRYQPSNLAWGRFHVSFGPFKDFTSRIIIW